MAYNKITNEKMRKNMNVWGILAFVSFISCAEAVTIDVSFEEGETSPPLSRPEMKREEKKREDLPFLKEEGNDSKESLLPSGESSKPDREEKKLENLNSLEEEKDSPENPLSSTESSESSQEEKKKEDLTSLEEEDDSIENLLPPSESSDPAGGGLRKINQKYLSPDGPQPTPPLSWWERLYQWIFGS